MYEIDTKPEDLKQEVEGFDLKLGCKCSLVSTHEDDETFSDTVTSGEETHVRMWPFMVTKRASADTSARWVTGDIVRGMRGGTREREGGGTLQGKGGD